MRVEAEADPRVMADQRFANYLSRFQLLSNIYRKKRRWDVIDPTVAQQQLVASAQQINSITQNPVCEATLYFILNF